MEQEIDELKEKIVGFLTSLTEASGNVETLIDEIPKYFVAEEEDLWIERQSLEFYLLLTAQTITSLENPKETRSLTEIIFDIPTIAEIWTTKITDKKLTPLQQFSCIKHLFRIIQSFKSYDPESPIEEDVEYDDLVLRSTLRKKIWTQFKRIKILSNLGSEELQEFYKGTLLSLGGIVNQF